MANMARKVQAGEYQIGIYNVVRVSGEPRSMRWSAQATGKGTIGNGYIGSFPTLDAAHRQITGEDMRD